VTVLNTEEVGQGLLEYALIIILVAVVVLALLIIFGPAVGNIFSNIIANF
jgi:pilus assembly protein Flp/PilA